MMKKKFDKNRFSAHQKTTLKATRSKTADNLTDHFFALSPDLLCLITPDGYFQRLSLSWEKILGYSLKELLTQPAINFIHPDDINTSRLELEKVINGNSTVNFENRYRSHQGNYKWFSWSCSPLDSTEGVIYAIGKDITNYKELEAKLRENESRYLTILNTLTEGVIMQNANGEINDCNASAETILGLTADQMMGRTSLDPCWQSIRPDGSDFPGEEHPISQTLKTGKAQKDVIMGVHKPQAQLTWVQINSQPLFYTNETKPYAAVASFIDITEKQKALADLQLAYQELEATFEQAAVGIAHWHPLQGIQRVNRKFAQILGFATEEILGKSLLDIIYLPDRQTHQENFRSLVAQEIESYTQEQQYIRKNGTLVWVKVTASLVKKEIGEPHYVIAIIENIDDRKQAELQLQETQIFLDSIINNLPLGIFVKDAKTLRLIHSNQVACNIFGKTLEEMKGKTDYEIFPKEQADWFNTCDLHVLTTQERLVLEENIPDKSGKYSTLKTQKILIYDRQKQPKYLLGITEDITELKHAEAEKAKLLAALQKSEDCFLTLKIATSQIVWQIAKDGLVEDMPEWRDYTGQTREQVKGWGWLNAVHPDDQERVREVWSYSVRTGHFYDIEYRIRAKNGTYGDFWVRGIPILEGDGTVREWMGICTDITARKQAQIALQEINRRLDAIFNSMFQYMVLLNPYGHILQANRTALNLLEISHDQIAGRPFWLAPWWTINNATQQQLQQAIYRASQGQFVRYEVDIWDRHQEIITIDFSLKPIVDEHDQIVLLIAEGRNITESKKMRETLRINEERLNLALFASDDGMWDWNIITGETYYSPRWCAILGYEVADIPPYFSTFESLLHPDDAAVVFTIINNHFANQSVTAKAEMRVRTKSGEWKWVYTQGKVVSRDQNGAPLRMVGTTKDITDRKVLELELAKQQALFNSFFSAAPAGMCILDKDLRYQQINEVLAQSNGIPASDHIGQIMTELLPDIASTLEPMLRKVIDTGVPVLNLEVVGKTVHQSDVERAWITSYFALSGTTGETIGLGIVVIEITDRKNAEKALAKREEALAKSERRYQRLAANVPGMLYQFVRQPDGRQSFNYVSPASLEIFELSPPKMQENFHVFESLIYSNDLPSLEASIIDSAETMRAWEWEGRIITPSHQMKWIRCTSRPELMSNGNVIWDGLILDITEQKSAQEVVREREAQYRELAARESLLNRIATQIRNSLDLDAIVQATVSALQRLLEVDICAFSWYRPHTNPPTWEITAEHKLSHINSWLGSYPVDSSPIFTATILAREIVKIDDVYLPGDEVLKESLIVANIASLLSLPVPTQSGELGVISLASIGEAKPWERSDIALLQAVVNQLAIALNQAELYHSMQKAERKAIAKTEEVEQAYRELQQTQTKLIQAEKMSSLGQLVAGVAHEINNPVSFIYGNLEPASDYVESLLTLLNLYQQYYPQPPVEIVEKLIEFDFDYIREDVRKLISSMKMGAERIREIVKSLRTFSRLDEAEMKAVNLHDNLESTLIIIQNRFNGRAGNPEIKLIKNYGQLPKVECYVSQLNQVFMNLLLNGIDAIEEYRTKLSMQGINYEGCIVIRTEVVGTNRVAIGIKDNGYGIPDKVKQKLFDPFFTTKPVGKGTGLGLAISYQIVVEKHGGSLSCISEMGKGTEFVVEIPIKASK